LTRCRAMAFVPERAGDALRRELAPLFFALFIFLFLTDAVYNRLGSSNGKFISFVDTCRSVAQYRSGLPDTARDKMSGWRMMLITLASFMVKFASNSLVSVLLGKVPVVFSGPRHVAFFFLGFALVWFSPSDLAYRTMRHSRALKLLVDMGGGLYKMRKVIFAVEAATTARGNFPFALLVAVIAVDGTTLTRRAMQWVEARMEKAKAKRRRRVPLSRSLSTLCFASGRGARQTLLTTVLPIGSVTALVWVAASSEWISGITDDSFLELRAALLALFIWRAGALDELARIHVESMEMSEEVHIVEQTRAKTKVS